MERKRPSRASSASSNKATPITGRFWFALRGIGLIIEYVFWGSVMSAISDRVLTFSSRQHMANTLGMCVSYQQQ